MAAPRSTSDSGSGYTGRPTNRFPPFSFHIGRVNRGGTNPPPFPRIRAAAHHRRLSRLHLPDDLERLRVVPAELRAPVLREVAVRFDLLGLEEARVPVPLQRFHLPVEGRLREGGVQLGAEREDVAVGVDRRLP